MNVDKENQLPAIRILNRFYAVFAAFCLILLVVGVPFVFVRKWGAALNLLGALVFVFTAWTVSRRGYPKQSLIFFSAILWVSMVALMFAGLTTNGAAVPLAFSLMLAIVVSQRAGLFYAITYLLAWLTYIVLWYYQLAPEPYFSSAPLTGWAIVAGACWLFLIPVPELVKSMHQGAALQRSVFEATSDALLVVSQSGRIENFNQRFVAMWGVPDAIVASGDGAAMREFVASQVDDPQAFLQRVNEIHAHPDETSFDTLRLRDGRVIERYSQPNVMGAKTIGRVWSLRDISEQKAYERTLTEARQHAEDASNAKGEFLANMSHEIRTPMNAILGMLKLLGNTSLSASQFDYLSKTEGAAKSLLGLLNDILDLSKIDSGKMELDEHAFSVDRLLRDLAVVLSASVGSKTIDVLFDIDPAIPAQLVGDALRLQQALVNLGGNAIKFTASGQVVIAMRRLPGDPQAPDRVQLEFSVQDSGIGIAGENQARIFSDFAQAESSTTRRFGGTGLGLAISQRLVELMGGHITLRSDLGVGSTFGFVLGMRVAAPETLGEAAMQSHARGLGAGGPQSAPLNGPRAVLVVDDNAQAGTIMQRMLGGLGWQVDLADSGPQALDRMRARSAGHGAYACVYVDWQMPGMDGWEFLRQLNTLGPSLVGPKPRITMLSANGRENLAQRTQEEQGLLSGFLVKPVTLSMLLDASQAQANNSETLRKAPRSSKRQLSGMRVLVVEDNAINQQVAEELLGFEGALVSIAADGRQGVNAVASAEVQFDVVLMDIQMPVMDGYAATHAIREQLGLTRLPIVGLTANAMASDREACLRAGMNEHMGKPFDMAQLVSLLIKLTGRQPPAPPQLPAAVVPATADIDLPAALNRMGGMRPLYVQSARLLQTMLATLPADLDERLQRTDWREADMLLHSLKGNAATLGLDRLAGALRELEALCKARPGRDAVQALAATLPPILQAAQQALIDAIQQLDEPARPSPRAAMTGRELAAAQAVVASQLVPLLMASDLAILAAYAQAKDTLAALPEGLSQRLDAALQVLDLQTALAVCREITAL
jgi:signal transduction histidine kinase/DNA-binding response OmpR family regulator